MINLFFPAILAQAHAVEVAGVSPFDQHLYQPDSDHMFGCLSDPSIRIPWSHINDDYCDCPDGSDEPGTAACSNGKFWCAGSEQYIPSRVVGDGVCDYEVCCDGSDEKPGVCPDRCAEVKAKQEERRQAELQFLQEGSRLRNEMVARSDARKDELQQSIEQLNNDIKETEELLSQQLEELAKAQDEDSKTNADPESVQAVVDLRNALRMTDEQLELLHSRFAHLRESYKLLNTALEQMSVEYNPNFNDPAVKDAIKTWKAHAAPELSAPATNNLLDEVERLEKIKIASDVEATQQTVESDWKSMLGSVLPPFISKRILQTKSTASTGPRVQVVQERIDELNLKLSQLQQNVQLDSKLLAVGSEFWGPDEIGRSAENLCVSIQRGDFKYEACLFGTAVQVDGVHEVQLGHSTGLKPEGYIEFVGGNRCPNGVDRSLTMYLECGHNTEAYSLEEPDMCHYVVKAKSPIVCYDNGIDKTNDKVDHVVHDEL